MFAVVVAGADCAENVAFKEEGAGMYNVARVGA